MKMEKMNINEYQIEKSKKESANVKTIVNNPKRLKNVARHLLLSMKKEKLRSCYSYVKSNVYLYDREVAFPFYNE